MLALGLGTFIVVFLIILISEIKNLIKSIGYKKVKAKVIDNVVMYSEDWGKYFPEQHEKFKNGSEKIQMVVDGIEKVGEIVDSIPISINKDGLTIKTRKNNIDEIENEKENEEEKEEQYVIIAEYTVDNKKYYYQNTFSAGYGENPYQKKVGKKINLKYDPKNPSNNVLDSESFKKIIFCVISIAIVLTFIVLFCF